MIPTYAPMKIDLAYMESRKYTDGISENKLDELRVEIASRHSLK
jgi:hypothetical protein